VTSDVIHPVDKLAVTAVSTVVQRFLSTPFFQALSAAYNTLMHVKISSSLIVIFYKLAWRLDG